MIVNIHKPLLVAVMATSMLLPAAAYAGRGCEQKPLTVQAVAQGLTLAHQVSETLDKSGARVVVLARAGQDLSKYKLHYSHLGYAYKTPEGPWRILHKLNECSSAESHVYRQGLGEFFLDDSWRYEAAWVVPTPTVQDALYPVILDERRHQAIHAQDYSMVAYVWSQRYQQSNQWAIEVLATAMESRIHGRKQAQAWLQYMDYQPTTLKVGPLTRLGGRMTKANIAFDDHPDEKRFSSRIETVTVDSVFDWLQRAGFASEVKTSGL